MKQIRPDISLEEIRNQHVSNQPAALSAANEAVTAV